MSLCLNGYQPDDKIRYILQEIKQLLQDTHIMMSIFQNAWEAYCVMCFCFISASAFDNIHRIIIDLNSLNLSSEIEHDSIQNHQIQELQKQLQELKNMLIEKDKKEKELLSIIQEQKQIINDVKQQNKQQQQQEIALLKRRQQKVGYLQHKDIKKKTKLKTSNITKNNSSTTRRKQKGMKGNISISREMTNKVIPFMVNTILSGQQLYEYMDGVTYLQSLDEFNTGQIRIFNYGFHDKNTNQILYCIADRRSKEYKDYKWRMRDKLFTLDEIKNVFCISENKLPQITQQTVSFINELNYQYKIKDLIKTNHQQIMFKTNWKNLAIFNKKKSNKKRLTLNVTKPEFKKELKRFITMNNNKDNDYENIIPIVIFDGNGRYHMEYIHIIKIYNNSIGVSYKYDSHKNMIKPTGFHLNKEIIQQKHQLISPKHDCQCLDNFISNIDDLQICDPNTKNNQLMYYKNRCEKLADFIKNSVEYILKIISNVANMNINNLQKWTEKAKKVTKNDKNMDITLDLSSLYPVDEYPDNTILIESSLYIKRLEEINNFYFQQTLNPIKEPIIPHQIHEQKNSMKFNIYNKL